MCLRPLSMYCRLVRRTTFAENMMYLSSQGIVNPFAQMLAVHHHRSPSNAELQWIPASHSRIPHDAPPYRAVLTYIRKLDSRFLQVFTFLTIRNLKPGIFCTLLYSICTNYHVFMTAMFRVNFERMLQVWSFTGSLRVLFGAIQTAETGFRENRP